MVLRHNAAHAPSLVEAVMPLDPQARAMIDRTLALNLPPVTQMTPRQARDSVRERSALLPREDVASVRDHTMDVQGGTITVRVFTPRGEGARPALVYFH